MRMTSGQAPAAAYLAGVRFDASPLDYFIQYPDPTLLKTDMLSTVWYFHMAPPLSTLFFGLVLNIFGSSFSTIFAAVYFTFGLALALWLYALMTALGGSQLVSVVLTMGLAAIKIGLFVVLPIWLIWKLFSKLFRRGGGTNGGTNGTTTDTSTGPPCCSETSPRVGTR